MAGTRVALAAGLVAAVFALVACTGAPPPREPLEPSPSQVPPDKEAWSHAVVEISPTDAAGEPCWRGSGTIVDAQGTILTNFHVVKNEPMFCDYQQLVISVTSSSDDPPEPAYLGGVLAFDPAVDLAVVTVLTDLDGDPVTEPFPFIPVGDSDAVRLGDGLTVLGYPGIGGKTVTLTEGVVSGFLESAETPGSRGWIKTQTSISGGNSGGAAISTNGTLIGVPTQVSAGDDVAVADCRFLQDTNGDGSIDQDDSCIPTGGFINGVRPVNLAAPLLVEAATADIIPVEDLAPIEEVIETSEPDAFGLRFGTDVSNDDELVGEDVAFPSGTTRLCGLFEYTGWSVGASYDLVWLLDGATQDERSIMSESWWGGDSGTWWICTQDGGPLEDGLWELFIYHDSSEALLADSVFVGDYYPVLPFDITNRTGAAICYLYASPVASSTWGQDELGSAEVLAVGATHQLLLAQEVYDFRAADCNHETLDTVGDVDIAVVASLTLDGSGG